MDLENVVNFLMWGLYEWVVLKNGKLTGKVQARGWEEWKENRKGPGKTRGGSRANVSDSEVKPVECVSAVTSP